MVDDTIQLPAHDISNFEHLAAGDDPVVAMCGQHADLSRQLDRCVDAREPILAALTAKWGKPDMETSPANILWGSDPDYPELVRLGDESDRLVGQITELANTIAYTSAESEAALRAKAKVAISMVEWPTNQGDIGDLPYHLWFACEVLRDAAAAWKMTDRERTLLPEIAAILSRRPVSPDPMTPATEIAFVKALRGYSTEFLECLLSRLDGVPVPEPVTA